MGLPDAPGIILSSLLGGPAGSLGRLSDTCINWLTSLLLVQPPLLEPEVLWSRFERPYEIGYDDFGMDRWAPLCHL